MILWVPIVCTIIVAVLFAKLVLLKNKEIRALLKLEDLKVQHELAEKIEEVDPQEAKRDQKTLDQFTKE